MADQKITQLTENTAPADEDVLPMVDDPAGTPVTKKVTKANLFGTTSIGKHLDVDTATTPPTNNAILRWKASVSKFVISIEGETFTFSILTFSDGESTTQLIGSGVWKADEVMTFAATYENGPPTTSDIMLSINGGAYNKIGSMVGPAYTGGTNDLGAINYPSAKDQTLRFRLDATDGADPMTLLETAITFRNYIRFGKTTEASGWDSADINALTGGNISNAQTGSFSVTAGASEYILFAFPSSYTAIHATGFLFNSITCPFETVATVSVTNGAGYTENYKVYRSTLANLGAGTLQTSTSSNLINKLYYGKTSATSGFTEADVEGLANAPVSNDNTQTWNSVTAGAGEYLLFAFPTRLGIPVFNVGGFDGGFQSPETVSITNANGYTENYYVWRSTNANLGATVVTTHA